MPASRSATFSPFGIALTRNGVVFRKVSISRLVHHDRSEVVGTAASKLDVHSAKGGQPIGSGSARQTACRLPRHCVDDAEATVRNGKSKLVLAGEVLVQCPLAEIGLTGNIVHCRPIETAGKKDSLGGIDDVVFADYPFLFSTFSRPHRLPLSCILLVYFRTL